MHPVNVFRYMIMPANSLVGFPSMEAAVLELAIAWQETRLIARRQGGGGPARGLVQFERGNATSHGGLWGVFNHPVSATYAKTLAQELLYNADDLDEVHAALEHNDLLTFGMARLLLRTDPRALPNIGEQDRAYAYYDRNWRPGKKRPQDWPESYGVAMATYEQYRGFA